MVIQLIPFIPVGFGGGGGQRAGMGGKLPWDKVLKSDTKNKKHKTQSKIIQQHLYQSDRLVKI